MSQYVLELDNDSFSKVESDALCIVDFWASWCMPCKMLAPIFAKVAQLHCDKMSFYKIDIDKCSAIAEKYNVQSIPTLVIMSNGKEIDRLVGMRNEEKLTADILKSINK